MNNKWGYRDVLRSFLQSLSPAQLFFSCFQPLQLCIQPCTISCPKETLRRGEVSSSLWYQWSLRFVNVDSGEFPDISGIRMDLEMETLLYQAVVDKDDKGGNVWGRVESCAKLYRRTIIQALLKSKTKNRSPWGSWWVQILICFLCQTCSPTQPWIQKRTSQSFLQLLLSCCSSVCTNRKTATSEIFPAALHADSASVEGSGTVALSSPLCTMILSCLGDFKSCWLQSLFNCQAARLIQSVGVSEMG